jgi:hypothetical protein
LRFFINDYRPLFPEDITAEERFRAELGRDLTPLERHYLTLAELALGPLSCDAPGERRSNVTMLRLKKSA